ncbi:MAG: hypothetical protein E7644_06370 [Ruminococcaceae bacterium]|nr:hypothetical protein [Oscillospiraceae bacterium]
MKKSDIFWQTYLNLEKDAMEVSKYIFFTDEILVNRNGTLVTQSCNTQLNTFSPHIADLLVRCCVQIEAISKELYFDNGGTKARGDSSILFDEDCLKLIDIKWKTHNKVVMIASPSFNLTKDENRIFKPLKEAHKRQGTYWEKAYQAVKHDRYSCLQHGNVKAFIQALAALYLLNIYYRNDSWVTKYQDISKLDYSMGSAIFTVKPPVADQLWYGNTPTDSESPFVVQYQDADYKRIESLQKKENQAINDYWVKQPELHEQAFLLQLQAAYDKERSDPRQRVIPIWELAKYRLNKKVPKTLPFEERKRLLINSEEWNGWVYQNNKHLTADELTEENIQTEIDKIGTDWGIEITKKLQKLEWLPIALNSEICKIYIP